MDIRPVPAAPCGPADGRPGPGAAFARALRDALVTTTGTQIAVVTADSDSRADRSGATVISIGAAGIILGQRGRGAPVVVPCHRCHTGSPVLRGRSHGHTPRPPRTRSVAHQRHLLAIGPSGVTWVNSRPLNTRAHQYQPSDSGPARRDTAARLSGLGVARRSRCGEGIERSLAAPLYLSRRHPGSAQTSLPSGPSFGRRTTLPSGWSCSRWEKADRTSDSG
nr:coenzyme F420-0:L-glutamate ligase [Streptomyces sp. SID5468]